ncbi:hypothetical protein, partial [Allofournierella massiliensis]|uniref:hypothetical protein n=1 Tax=Allofournierella massiliensis TaxID=1650663 RepID=UPI003567D7D7
RSLKPSEPLFRGSFLLPYGGLWSGYDTAPPFCYTLFVVFGSLQFQTTTKNEIGNPFGEVYLIFFILGYFATAPHEKIFH